MIHLIVAGQHMSESALVGALFVIAGLAQQAGRRWSYSAVRRGGLLVVATGNILVVGVWIVSRTTGLPIGLAPGVPEPVGSVDALTSAFELALVGWVVWRTIRITYGPRKRVRETG